MTGKEFIGRAQALVSSVRARAQQAEQLRRLPEETFREFREAGLFRALQPARFGGFELDPVSFYEAVIEIGTACASGGESGQGEPELRAPGVWARERRPLPIANEPSIILV